MNKLNYIVAATSAVVAIFTAIFVPAISICAGIVYVVATVTM